MKLLNTIKLLFLLLFSVEFVHAQSIDLPDASAVPAGRR